MIHFQPSPLLKHHTSFRIGGRAKYFFEATNLRDLEEAIRECLRQKMPYFILGGGTNLLVSDDGFPGVVIKMTNGFLEFSDDGRVRVGAGFDFPELVSAAAQRGFAGLEWAGGLPGTVGGAIRGNAGCFGGEVKDIVDSIEGLGMANGEMEPAYFRRTNSECEFRYRTSLFKEKKEIVFAAVFKLRPGADPGELKSKMEEKIVYRRERHPLEYPNAGSIFKNCDVSKVTDELRNYFSSSIKIDPFPVIPTAKILAESDLKGERVSGAEISTKHPNFIVNLGDASSDNVKKLIEMAKTRVKSRFGIEIEEEIQFV